MTSYPPNMNLHVAGAGVLVVTDLPFKVKKRSDTERLLAAKKLHSLVKILSRKPLQKESFIP